MTQEDFERLDAAIETIKRLMPEVEKTIRKAKAIVNYKELPNGNILSKDLFEFLQVNNASVRLLSIVKGNLYKGGYLTKYNSRQVWDNYCPIYEFLTEFRKCDFMKFRNCGTLTVKELNGIFDRNGIDWDNFNRG
jgi:hypothetical protein